MSRFTYIIGMFQSTRSHGARLPQISEVYIILCFNPRARTERDNDRLLSWTKPNSFNPRARTERDWNNPFLSDSLNCFNPRARTERDVVRRCCYLLHAVFQSTRSHGARHKVFCDNYLNNMFQSTRSHGARLYAKRQKKLEISVSIHALARSATL